MNRLHIIFDRCEIRVAAVIALGWAIQCAQYAAIGAFAWVILSPRCHAETLPQTLQRVETHVQATTTYEDIHGPNEWRPGPVGNCSTYAVNAQQALAAYGIAATLWVVHDELGEEHAVVLVGPYVLDSRLDRIETRTQLERDGYRFEYAVTPFQMLMQQRAGK